MNERNDNDDVEKVLVNNGGAPSALVLTVGDQTHRTIFRHDDKKIVRFSLSIEQQCLCVDIIFQW